MTFQNEFERDTWLKLVMAGSLYECADQTIEELRKRTERAETFRAFLPLCGGQKIWAIKALREVTGLGLIQSKEMVEGAPCVLARGLTEAKANAYRVCFKAHSVELVIEPE